MKFSFEEAYNYGKEMGKSEKELRLLKYAAGGPTDLNINLRKPKSEKPNILKNLKDVGKGELFEKVLQNLDTEDKKKLRTARKNTWLDNTKRLAMQQLMRWKIGMKVGPSSDQTIFSGRADENEAVAHWMIEEGADLPGAHPPEGGWPFRVGEQVWKRQDGGEWSTGIVTRLDPLEISVWADVRDLWPAGPYDWVAKLEWP